MQFSVGVAVGMAVCAILIGIIKTGLPSTKLYNESRQVIQECEKSLPRDQKCVIVLSTEIKENKQ